LIENELNFFLIKGVRSVHFRNDILSIGTGVGTVLFYDLRAHKFLKDPKDEDPLSQLKLKTSGGWIVIFFLFLNFNVIIFLLNKSFLS